MTDVISEINWTEKYRPKKLEDVALTSRPEASAPAKKRAPRRQKEVAA